MNDYKHCNHHHPLTDQHEVVDFGDGSFVANKEAIPLLKALNQAGLRTRTHHISSEHPVAFISILMDEGLQIEIKTVNEIDATRTNYNGLKEILIKWNRKEIKSPPPEPAKQCPSEGGPNVLTGM